MHIDGKLLLSRATVSSGRILSTFALGIILAKLCAIEPETITILGAPLKTADLSIPAICVIFFMSAGYFINWYGDHASFRTWNSGEKWQNATNFEGREEPLSGQIETLGRAIGDLKFSQERFEDLISKHPESSMYLEKSNEQSIQLQERVENLQKGVESLSWKAKVILYGWHFAMPLGLAIVAFFMLLFDIG